MELITYHNRVFQTSSLVYSFRQVHGLYLGWNTVALAEIFVEYLNGI